METNRTASVLRGGLLALVSLLLGLGLTSVWLSVTHAAGGEVFLVNHTGDGSDDAPGNCICHASSGYCTLRAAIEEANACAGGQTINFSFQHVIQPNTALPKITDDYTVIDASDRWISSPGGVPFPGVMIDGQGKDFSGLEITSTHNAVYGLQILHFNHHGLYLHDEAAFNQIGGTDPNQRNIISANSENGVYIYGSQAVSNTVSGNYIGLNAIGTGDPFGTVLDWSNGWHGVSIWYGEKNLVAENWIADNNWSGVAVDDASLARIHHNRLGLDVNDQPVGNDFYGVHVDHSAYARIWQNLIAYNQRGVYAAGGSFLDIYNNTIYSNTALALDPPSGGGVLLEDTDTQAYIMFNDILSNTAAFGSGIATRTGADSFIFHNHLFSNHLNTSGDFEGGGGAIYIRGGKADIEGNHIYNNSLTGDMGADSLLFGGGIYLNDPGEVIIHENLLHDNHVQTHDGGGGAIAVLGGSLVAIEHNQIWDNSYDADLGGGSGIFLYNFSEPSTYLLDRNWIAFNQGSISGTVQIQYNTYFTFTNNIIAHNTNHGLYLDQVNSDAYGNHNIIADNAGSGIVLDESNLELQNSILAGNSRYGVQIDTPLIWGLVQGRNDVWGNTLGGSNIDWLDFYMKLDPRFFDPAQARYDLRLGSPCLDDGSPSSLTSSFNSVPRPQGRGPDIGAYEIVQSYLPLLRK